MGAFMESVYCTSEGGGLNGDQFLHLWSTERVRAPAGGWGRLTRGTHLAVTRERRWRGGLVSAQRWAVERPRWEEVSSRKETGPARIWPRDGGKEFLFFSIFVKLFWSSKIKTFSIQLSFETHLNTLFIL